MSSTLIRDTALGYVIRLVTRNKYLRYPEEQLDFRLPDAYVKAIEEQQRHISFRQDEAQDPISTKDGCESGLEKGSDQVLARTCSNIIPAVQEKTTAISSIPTQLDGDIIIVSWYHDADPDNPQNWSGLRKAVAAGMIVVYTLAIYVGSSICTPSYNGERAQFGISEQVVSLTLSLYVLAYGLGPLLWSPLSEIPSIGRNPPYIITFGLFIILVVPTALVENFAGLVVLRFLLGFFGGTSLATGPATMGDIYSFAKLPYGLSLWAFAATSGPAIAPLISGFSVPAENWRWSYWEMLWLSGPIWVALFVFLPETSSSNILLRRARRLRKLTGCPHLKSQSEIDQSHLDVHAVVIEALWRPAQLMILDPSIAFTAFYSALIYGIFYSFFEAFPHVYMGIYGFNLGQQGLVFLSINVGAGIAICIYWTYIRWIFEPEVVSGKLGTPERRLIPSLPASFLLPIGMFIFAWTASPGIPWIAPTIGITVVLAGIFIVLQCVFLYLPLSYPQYSASLFAGNDAARSILACATIHFSIPLYDNLGVARGVSLLAGLTVGCIGGMFILYFFGAKLRARSRFAA